MSDDAGLWLGNRVAKARACYDRISILAVVGRPVVWHHRDNTGTLQEDNIHFWMDRDLGLQREKVKRNFLFDGASKPRALWPIVGHPWGLSLEGGIKHDWDFVHRPWLAANGQLSERVSFEYAAAYYKRMLERAGASAVQADAELLAVLSLPALIVWRRHDEEFA